jgi:hypothetical protein
MAVPGSILADGNCHQVGSAYRGLLHAVLADEPGL